ncbi:amino acid adenylation domain-containing protein [Lentzea albidocapillata subsp. violacea]|uniref:Amino acid adenylation domain-containing protein n=1 Tax=Lentzea albidocapillata subsp. violacea TaxID=128104 RepID=A0A1G9XT67_9PSEU|nr:AMP-binding protein [Lentzea albidocapillata]SDN00009.1 amino acid adenylation domain-containing protein [Lentzea albidocapillata subsp. violacea]
MTRDEAAIVDTAEWNLLQAIDLPTAVVSGPLGGLLDAHVRRSSSALAVSDGTRRMTYAELSEHSDRFAGWLRRMGLRPGDRVVARAEPTVDFVVALHAVLRSGMTLVPVHPAHTGHELEAVVADADPALVLIGDDDPAPDSIPAFTLAAAAAASASAAVTKPAPRAEPTGPAFLLYTSGSSGQPKGVVCDHMQVRTALGGIAHRLRYRNDDVVFCRLPLAFDYGLYQILLSALAGAHLVLVPGDTTVDLAALVSRTRATVLPVVPTLASMILALARRGPDLSCVRLITNTGEFLGHEHQRALLTAMPAAELSLMYGLTECKRVSVRAPARHELPADTVGSPLPGTGVAILDDTGRSLPCGEVGQIVTRGPHVTSGYWRSPELTAQRFARCRTTGRKVLFTGDFGHITTEGELVVLGRHDDQYKAAGMRVSGGEVEAAASGIPGVRGAVLIPPRAGRGAVLWVETALATGRVVAELRHRLDPAKVPRQVQVVSSFPLTANGKLDRAHVRSWTGEES